jgi:hypothetical protein
MANEITRGNTTTALVPDNPSIVKLSKRLRWKPETAIRRIQHALPAPVEQQIYLELAADFGILPESMAKLLRFYIGEESLELDDLDPHSVGDNLVSTKFTNFVEFLVQCLNLLKIVAKEFTSFSLTIEHAAIIVTHYGTDQPEALLEMIDGNLEELCEMVGISNEKSYEYRMRTCVWVVVKTVIAENRKSGRPDILDPSDLLDFISEGQREMRRALLDADPTDYLAADSSELRKHPQRELLKKAGVLR